MNRFLAAVALVIGAGSCVESFFLKNVLMALKCKAALAPTGQELLAMSGYTATCLVGLNLLPLLEGPGDNDAQAPMPGPDRQTPMAGPDRARQQDVMIETAPITLFTIIEILMDKHLYDEVVELNYCIADKMNLVDSHGYFMQSRFEDYIMQKVSFFNIDEKVEDALMACPNVINFDTAAFMACVMLECITP